MDEATIAYSEALFDCIRSLSADEAGVTRQGYGPVESAVLDVVEKEGLALDMAPERDAAGNLWLTMKGRTEGPATVIFSHVDSVPQGGNYDGLAGVVAGLAVAQRLRRNKVVPEADFKVLALRCEESSFFGKAYVGSLAMLGRLTEKDLALKHRTLDKTLGEAMRECGLDTARLTSGTPVVDLSKLGALYELHIEQGPMLDMREDVRVGIVTGIRGNRRHKCVRAIGQTAHSGAVDKAWRHDAVMACAELLHEMELHWQSWLDRGFDLVMTAGVLKTAPTAAISVIPGEVTFTLDIRGLDDAVVERFTRLFVAEAERIGRERGVEFVFDDELVTRGATLSAPLMEKLEAGAKAANVPVTKLPSGAGHDSAVFANAGLSVAMLFVANQKGSHNPFEAMRIEDFAQGVDVLYHTVAPGSEP